ncbi:hypothetical protein [Nocardiopsis halotolerans]|uniref:hypothetical protein n=1 Tax=Nocardiopsis halotolerans TaxID=124252 RepID=UPI00036EB163|nr:hypothetical protein [Nocardiopsis halotolerans]
MQTGPDVLRSTAWDRTFHAHGSGADAPERLTPLLTGGTCERKHALDYLYGSILHQGTVYPATVPAALFVAGILDRPELDDLARDSISEAMGAAPSPLRQSLLGFLTDVADSAAAFAASTDATPVARAPLSEDERVRLIDAVLADDADDEAWSEGGVETLMDEAADDLRAAAPALNEAVRPFLTCHDPLTRIRAVEAAAATARLGGLALDLSGAADMAETRDEGAVIVLALGECGGDTTEFLTHADPAIRACAALAPSQRDNPVATGELVAALAGPAEADAWFTTRPAFFPARVRFTLVRTLAERSTPEDAARLLPVLRALAPLTSVLTAAEDAGPLLALAFPPRDGDEKPPVRARNLEELTGVQRDYLRVLADSDGFWHDRIANFRVVLARLGLPGEREEVRALLGG